ncbi:hypothetical protein J6590_044230, partial [Homalodisca vitripennis]
IDMPQRSPDITPMDFFLWGVVKASVYSRKPHTIDELKDYIHEAFYELDNDPTLCLSGQSTFRHYQCFNRTNMFHFGTTIALYTGQGRQGFYTRFTRPDTHRHTLWSIIEYPARPSTTLDTELGQLAVSHASPSLSLRESNRRNV